MDYSLEEVLARTQALEYLDTASQLGEIRSRIFGELMELNETMMKERLAEEEKAAHEYAAKQKALEEAAAQEAAKAAEEPKPEEPKPEGTT